MNNNKVTWTFNCMLTFFSKYVRCLEKNPDHRPYMEELLEHPFITQVPDNVSLY